MAPEPSEPAVFVAAGEGVKTLAMVAEGVVLDVDVGLALDAEWVDDVEEASAPKHEMSVPFTTEKGNEDAVEPPATVAKNWYVPCITFTLGQVQVELDASMLDASSMYDAARFSDIAALLVTGKIEGKTERSKTASLSPVHVQVTMSWMHDLVSRLVENVNDIETPGRV